MSAINYGRFVKIMVSLGQWGAEVPSNEAIRAKAKKMGLADNLSDTTIAEYRKRYIGEQAQAATPPADSPAALPSALSEALNAKLDAILPAMAAVEKRIIARHEKEMAALQRRVDEANQASGRAYELERKSKGLQSALDWLKKDGETRLAEADGRLAKAEERYARLWDAFQALSADFKAKAAEADRLSKALADAEGNATELKGALEAADEEKKAREAPRRLYPKGIKPLPDDNDKMASALHMIMERERAAMAGGPYVPTTPSSLVKSKNAARRIAQLMVDQRLVEVRPGKSGAMLMTPDYAATLDGKA